MHKISMLEAAGVIALAGTLLSLAGCAGRAFPTTLGQDAATGALPMSFPTSAASQAQRRTPDSRYSLTRLPTLGGTQAFANFINDRGWIAGAADLGGGQNEHAFLWRDGQITDLGTLGGINSLAWPVNNQGLLSGDSLTADKDPLQENFCNFTIDGTPQFSDRTCRGFLAKHGALTALPTLGGNNSSVFGINGRGQVVGAAETTTHDKSCAPPQVLRYEAVIWMRDGSPRKLQPFAGDTVGIAAAINNQGIAVGGSGACATISPAVGAHALLWERDGSPKYLGGLGGAFNNAAFDINNRGDVVGFSDLPGDATTHAVLWQNGTMKDLGTLPGDFASFAFGINDRGQIVGQSCDVNFNCRAFIWQNGRMADLNALVPASSLYLMLGESINSRGQITGIAFDQDAGGVPAYLATPNATVRARVMPPASRPTVLPDRIRAMLRRLSRTRL